MWTREYLSYWENIVPCTVLILSTRSNSLQEVCHESEGYFTGYVTEQAKNNGLAPFLWDIQHGGLFDRSTGTILLQTVYNQLKEGAERGQYPY